MYCLHFSESQLLVPLVFYFLSHRLTSFPLLYPLFLCLKHGLLFLSEACASLWSIISVGGHTHPSSHGLGYILEKSYALVSFIFHSKINFHYKFLFWLYYLETRCSVFKHLLPSFIFSPPPPHFFPVSCYSDQRISCW